MQLFWPRVTKLRLQPLVGKPSLCRIMQGQYLPPPCVVCTSPLPMWLARPRFSHTGPRPTPGGQIHASGKQPGGGGATTPLVYFASKMGGHNQSNRPRGHFQRGPRKGLVLKHPTLPLSIVSPLSKTTSKFYPAPRAPLNSLVSRRCESSKKFMITL